MLTYYILSKRLSYHKLFKLYQQLIAVPSPSLLHSKAMIDHFPTLTPMRHVI